MKKSVLFIAFSICIAGCITQRSKIDAFEELREQVKNNIGTNWECSLIMTNEISLNRSNLYFEVESQHSPFTVMVTKSEFIAPKEWRSRYQAATNTFDEFFKSANATNSAEQFSTLTNQPHFFEQFSNALCSLDLPGWHYKSIGVDVDVQSPDVAYPEIGKDGQEAQQISDKVVSFLTPYQKE